MTTNITIITVISLLCFTFLVAYFGYLIMKTEIYKVRRLLRIIAKLKEECKEHRQNEKDILDEWFKEHQKLEELRGKLYSGEENLLRES